MTKFHVGDRVRVSPPPGSNTPSGVGVVDYVYSDSVYQYDVGLGEHGRFPAKEEWLRPADIYPQESDSVNHPAHYTAYKGVEVIDFAEQMNFCLGNVVKYVARAGRKAGADDLEDLRKARWYLEREIERRENLRSDGV